MTTTPVGSAPAFVRTAKYRLDPGDEITTEIVAERLARRIGNTVDPLLPGPEVRARCVAAVLDLPSLIRDLLDEANGRPDLVEARQAAAAAAAGSARADAAHLEPEPAPNLAPTRSLPCP